MPNDSLRNIEQLSAEIHKLYCIQYEKDHGESYWTGGDYSKLEERVKEYDRNIARFVTEQVALARASGFADGLHHKREIKLLCREHSSDKTVLRYDLNGYCEECDVNTGHLCMVEILSPAPIIPEGEKLV